MEQGSYVTDRPTVISAAPSAFAPDGALDLAGTRRVFDLLAGSDIDSIFVAGTTGEFPALSDDERTAVIEAAIEAAGPERVIAHVGAASGYQAAALLRGARQVGATTFAAITPFYLPGSPAGVRSYFEAVTAAAEGLPVYAYLFPRLTGTEVTPAEAARLVNELGLAGVKLSIPGTGFLADLHPRVSSNVGLFSGNDGLLQAVVAAGGTGVVSGVSPACPAYFTQFADAIAAGDSEMITRYQALVDEAVAAIGPSLSFLKAALVEQGVIASGTCRMAVDPPDTHQLDRITAVLSASVLTPAGAAREEACHVD